MNARDIIQALLFATLFVALPASAQFFPYYGKKAPYFFFLLGTRNDAKGIPSTNHTPAFDVDEDALPLGVRAMATLAWDFLSARP